MNKLQNQFYDEFLTFDPVTFVPFETKLINYDLLDERAVSAILSIINYSACGFKMFDLISENGSMPTTNGVWRQRDNTC